MLGEMIGIKPNLIVIFDEPQAIAIMLAELEAPAIEMVENAEIDFHDFPCRSIGGR